MSVAKVTEISAASEESFEAAIRLGLQRANQSLQNVTGAWIAEQKVDVNGGAISRYRVTMKVTFVLE